MFFNNSFRKVFTGTQVTGAGAGQNPNVNLSNGFVITAGLNASVLNNVNTGVANNNYGPGTFGIFDADTYASKVVAGLDSCCPIVIAGASIYDKDSLGGTFHGGYQETNKSKKINPKYVTAFRRIDACVPQAMVTHIGTTNYTSTLNPLNPACSFEFLCGETYTLRVDVRGAPALRFLNHQAYRLIDFYTGCCPDGAPLTVVDSTLVMIGWAKKIVGDPILSKFINPIVFDEAGVAYYSPESGNAPSWDTYVSVPHTPGLTAGLRLNGAYFDTVFDNCTFQVTDYFGVEPVLMNISMVDFVGDPCAFEGICVVNECNGLMVNGTGEQAVRDLIMSEAYRQNFVHTDLRIREVTMGNQIVGALNRKALYTRYQIQHNVPRHNNNSSQYDHDQYDLNIITNGTNAAFELAMTTWLNNCANCTTLKVSSCTPCTILPVV